MPYKDPEKRKAKAREYSAKHYAAHKAAHIEAVKKVRREGKREWLSFKASLGCSQCGVSHPAVIDFHHPPGTKKYAVNKLVSDGNYARAYAEASKCIILCANCHRIHHYDERVRQK